MLVVVYTAVKCFALGLLVGLLTAPRSGGESRRLLANQFTGMVRSRLPASSGGTAGPRPPRA